MRLTVLGACGAWPEPGSASSGYLVEQEGFRLLLDVGYATFPQLLRRVGADQIDAVFVSHRHPDHCADLNPLLRARALRAEPCPPLPVYALPGALDPVLTLDEPHLLADAYQAYELPVGSAFEIGPFRAETRLLPHWVPNAGVRLTAAGRTLAYTGDTGPETGVVSLARGADLFLAEATFVDEVPVGSQTFQTSARQAGQQALAAGVGRLLLTHLWPGTPPERARAAATAEYDGEVGVAAGDLVIDL